MASKPNPKNQSAQDQVSKVMKHVRNAEDLIAHVHPENRVQEQTLQVISIGLERARIAGANLLLDMLINKGQ